VVGPTGGTGGTLGTWYLHVVQYRWYSHSHLVFMVGVHLMPCVGLL